MPVYFVFFVAACLLSLIPRIELVGLATLVLLFSINPVFFICCLPIPVAAYFGLQFFKRK